jgi:hypothetical protein
VCSDQALWRAEVAAGVSRLRAHRLTDLVKKLFPIAGKISLAGTLVLINTASAALSSSGLGGEEMRAARLKELEEMAAKLLETACKLPSGQDRHNALREIERFRARITALQRLDLQSAQSPQPYDLVTRPCTIDAARFRWDIRENGRPIQSSMESFATKHEARADGRHELEKVIQVSRL